MGPRFLIDTNAVIDYFRNTLPLAGGDWLERLFDSSGYAISVVTRMELYASPSISTAEELALDTFTQASLILPLDEPVIAQTIALRRQYRRKLPDAIIAATALVHDLTLVTRNVADFKAITGLRVLDPHDVAGLPAI